MNYAILSGIGLFAGIVGGFVGIGGGVIMIPLLVFILGYDQHLAQGTTLAAMVPPIGLLAAMEYYNSGHVNITAAVCIATGFFIGGFIGANFAVRIDGAIVKKIFAATLFIISIKYFFD